jgi:hypothetical protein
LTTLVLVGSLAATSGGAQAHSHWGIDVGIGIAAGALLKAAAVSMPTLSQFRLAVWSRVMTVGKCTQDPGLRLLLLLLISWIGACNVHPRADLEDPPGMSPSGRVTSFRI